MKPLWTLFCLLLLTNPLSAEIEKVVVGYTASLCDQKCMDFTKRQFELIPEVANVQVTPGQVILDWKPKSKFSFQTINYTMRRIGLGMANTSVTARGTIQKQGDKLYLVSIGDNTRFRIVNPPAPESGSYVEYNNIAMYELLPGVRDALETAMRKDQLVTVAGYLLAPWRYELTIVLGNYRVEDEEEEEKQ